MLEAFALAAAAALARPNIVFVMTDDLRRRDLKLEPPADLFVEERSAWLQSASCTRRVFEFR
jgi:hypothetical protein